MYHTRTSLKICIINDDFLGTMNQRYANRTAITVLKTIAITQTPLFPSPNLPHPLSLATVAVPVTPPPIFTPVAVPLSPQTYPLGQQPPPPASPQLNQPWAHPPSPNAAPVVLTGTLTITPLLFRATVEEAAGQDVLEQSRPTRQQPPW